MAKIKFKRGPSQNLLAATATLEAGEPLFTTDQGKLYVFDGTNLIEVNPDRETVPDAGLTVAGIVMLTSAVNSNDETKAATAKAVKLAYDLAASKAGTSIATQLANGLLSAADKTKIDGLKSAAYKDTGTASGNVVMVGTDGKINASLMPALAIAEPFPAANEATMLALSAQTGDIAIRADVSKSFILRQTPASTLGNWLELKTPDCAVLSVAGRTGVIVLTKADVGLGNVTNESKATMFANAALTGKPTAPTATAATNTTQIATTAFVKAQGYLTAASTIDGGTF